MLVDFELVKIIQPLQEWFQKNARILPWRENPDPYHVWISEIMLQQTRVEAVKPYFDRFITELPNVKALADCPEERYLKLWEGLGYYNRVRNLHVAARQMMEEFGGRIPEDFESLLKLKGIGRYTAGAIASIAYKKRVPAVDGNVLRVLTRVSGDDSDIMKQSVRNIIEERLFILMQERKELIPEVFNQALMELGALVCVPNGTPHCNRCPWNDFCVARLENRIAEIPVKKKAKARKIEKRTVFVLRDGDRVAIQKRPAEGILAGMYELPNTLSQLGEKEAITFLKKRGYEVLRIQSLGKAKHIFSHVEWHMTGYAVFVDSFSLEEHTPEGVLFVDARDVAKRYAIPSAFAAYAKYMQIDLGAKRLKQEQITENNKK